MFSVLAGSTRAVGRKLIEGRMSKREYNRQQKKRQIIEAARQLMKSRQTSGFSMRNLADLAGVSVATPYNLFGSKQEVIAAVMDTDLDDYRRALLSEPKDPLDIFFHAVSVTRQLFETDPHYYRAGAEAVHGETDEQMNAKFSLPRHLLMRDLVLHAVQEGFLSHRTNAESLALTLGQQFYGWIQAWAQDKISLADMEARTQYGFALTLAGLASDAQRPGLMRLALDIQETLPESWQQQTNAATAANS